MIGWLFGKRKIKRDETNLEYLPYADLPVNRILEGADKANLKHCSLVGWTADGKLYIASSHPKRAAFYWDLCLAAKEIMAD